MPNTTDITPQNFYKPSELMGIFKNFFSNKEINAKVLCLQGVYYKSDRAYGNVAYDQLRDENTTESMTMVVPMSLRDNLKNGNLVTVYGTLDRRTQNNASIQFLLNVSRVEKVKDIAISEDEVKRAEYRRRKGERGYKNVDGILEAKLFANQRPQVALVYADSSITNADFEKGLAAAKSNVDFHEERISFANATALCNLLQRLDTQNYDVIAIVRGGGSGIEKLDDLAVVEILTELNTAWIYGVGHEKENLFIRNIADKVIPIPFALGTYFRDLVESVIQKRNNSRAVLVQEVKKQYEKQIEDSNKKNIELTKRLESLQKQNKEQSENSQKQIAALTKSLTDSQKQSKEQVEKFQKAADEAQKQSKAQAEAAAKVNKDLQDRLEKQGKTLSDLQIQQQKQQTEFNKSLGQMQEANKGLQASLTKMTESNSRTTDELNDTKRKLSKALQQKPNVVGYWIVIAILVVLLIVALVK